MRFIKEDLPGIAFLILFIIMLLIKFNNFMSDYDDYKVGLYTEQTKEANG